MLSVAGQLHEFALLVAGGTTFLLLIGCSAMFCTRSPAHRQWTGELTMVSVLVWLLAASLPLPRLLPSASLTRLFDIARAPMEHPEIGVNDGSGSPPALAAIETEDDRFDEAMVDESSGKFDQRDMDDLLAATTQPPTNVGTVTERSHTGLPSFASPTLDTTTRFIAAYLGGSALCLFWLAVGRTWLAYLRHMAKRPPRWLTDLFEPLCNDTGHHPQLVVSRSCPRPITWDLRRPVIVLPVSMVRRSKREQLRMVLLHELAHVERRDGWGNLLICLALPLLYGHPLFWWLRGQVRLAAELLADDRAAQRAGNLAYVEQLVALAQTSRPSLIPLAGSTAAFSSSSQFYRRMQMLISRTGPSLVVPSSRWRLSSLMIACVFVVIAAAMAGLQPVAAHQAAGNTEAESSRPEEGKADANQAPDLGFPVQKGKSVEVEQPLEKLPLLGRLFAAETAAGEPDANSEAEALRAKLAATEQQLRALEAELSALRDATKTTSASTAIKTIPPQPITVTLTRVNEDGSISLEGWSAGEDGRPEKLMWKKVTASGDSPIAAAKPGVIYKGEVVKEFKRIDGTLIRHVYDRETGKLIRTWKDDGTSDEPPSQTEQRTYPTAAPPQSRDYNERAPEKPQTVTGGVEHNTVAGLDLVNLATVYADAVAEVEAAEAKFAAIEDAVVDTVISRRELESAKVAVNSAKRKHKLLRNLTSVAAEAAKADLERIQKLVGSDAAPSRFAEAESRLKMLRAILDSGPPTYQAEKLLGVPGKP